MKVEMKEHISGTAWKKDLEEKKRKAIKATAIEFARLSEPYVPFLTGAMSKSVYMSDYERGEVSYNTPYARHVYYLPESANLTRDHKPNAHVAWSEFVASKYKADLTRVFRRFMGGAL